MDAVDAYAEVVSRDHDAAAGMMDTDFADDDGAGGGDALPDYVAQASNAASTSMSAATEHLIDIREYDVPYCLRVAIDQGGYTRTCLHCRIAVKMLTAEHPGPRHPCRAVVHCQVGQRRNEPLLPDRASRA